MEKAMEKATEISQKFFSWFKWTFPTALAVILIVQILISQNILAYWDIAPIYNLVFVVAAIGVVYFALWLASLIARIALSKGRSWTPFFILSLFFPLIMWIIVSVISVDENSSISSSSKKCPKCAEYVKKEATLCKHCGSSI